MIINGVKYQLTGPNDELPQQVTVKLLRGKGSLRQTSAVFAPPNELAHLRAAIDHCLTGQGPELALAIVNLIDSDGHSWLFDRRGGVLRVFCDKQPVDWNQASQEAVFAIEPFPLTIESIREDLLGTFHVYPTDGSFLAFDDRQRSHSIESKIHILNELSNHKLSGIRSFVPELAALSMVKLIKLLNYIEPSYREWLEIQKEASVLRQLSCGSNDHEASPTGQEISHLEAQIELIELIEVTAQPLLGPTTSLENLISSYKSCVDRLEILCAEHNVIDPESLGRTVDWQETLKTITRLSLYEQLVKASELAFQKSKGTIEPLLKAYYEAIETFLRNDHQITSELQDCLALLSNELKESFGSEASKVGQIVTSLSQLLRAYSNKTRTMLGLAPKQMLALPLVQPQEEQRLEQSRMAVDYALGRIGELHANLCSNQDSHAKILVKVQDRHEKLVAEYGRLKYSWRELAKQHGFPKKCTIRDLLGMIQNQGEIVRLHKEQASLKQDISQYHYRLEQLSRQIADWRHLTQSVKDTPLDNPQILLAEARAILDYASQKKNQLTKLKKMQVESLTKRRLDQLVSSRIATVMQRWHEGFRAANLSPMDIRLETWLRCFEELHCLRSLRVTEEFLGGSLNLDKVLSDLEFKQPLKTLVVSSCHQHAPQYSLLIESLKDHGLSQGQIVLTNDSVFAKQLESSGIPISKLQSKPVQSPSRVEGAQGQSAILSPKARKALETLTNPQAASSRLPI